MPYSSCFFCSLLPLSCQSFNVTCTDSSSFFPFPRFYSFHPSCSRGYFVLFDHKKIPHADDWFSDVLKQSSVSQFSGFFLRTTATVPDFTITMVVPGTVSPLYVTLTSSPVLLQTVEYQLCGRASSKSVNMLPKMATARADEKTGGVGPKSQEKTCILKCCTSSVARLSR